MSSFNKLKAEQRNAELLEEMVSDLATQPGLRDELNEHFQELNGVKGRDEFAACITFFFLGRLYERLLKQQGDTKNATRRM